MSKSLHSHSVLNQERGGFIISRIKLKLMLKNLNLKDIKCRQQSS